MKKYCYIIASALLGSCLSGSVTAATVSFITPNPINVAPGENFTLTLQGTDFTTPADGGGFTFNWTSSVLRYVSTTIPGTPWDAFAVNDTAALAGGNQVNNVFVATSGTAVGPTFNIADITFQFIGNAGDTSEINFADVFGGWITTGAVPIPVTYVNAQVQAVPLPAAFLFFVSAVMGLGFFRKRDDSSRSS